MRTGYRAIDHRWRWRQFHMGRVGPTFWVELHSDMVRRSLPACAFDWSPRPFDHNATDCGAMYYKTQSM